MISVVCYKVAETVSGNSVSSSSINDILTNINTFTEIIVNIIVIVGGIVGANYVKKQREKQIDSTFSYLTKLNVRMKIFRELLNTYKDEIIERFLPRECRREISPDRIGIVNDRINYLAKLAEETLEFVKSEDGQMPAQKGWISHFNKFIEFLVDCEQLRQPTYYKWVQTENLEEKQESYYTEVVNNIDKMIEMVNTRQKELEDEIFKDD